MPPTKIMVIRHGEKHKFAPILHGVQDKNINEQRALDPSSLNRRGWLRAAALVEFFMAPATPDVSRPDRIFATRPDDHIQRPNQTVAALAQALWPAPEEFQQRFDVSIEVGEVTKL